MTGLGASNSSIGPDAGAGTGEGTRWPAPPWKFGVTPAAMMNDRGNA